MSELSPHTEVILSSDLFDDDPCLENMSALASAVLDAYMSGYGWLDGPTKKDCRGVAAALRAAALHLYCEEIVTCGGSSYALVIEQEDILALADELEAQ
jgi:hypothetical protein